MATGLTPLNTSSSMENKHILMADDPSYLRNWIMGDKIIALLKNTITIIMIM